jgi:hypothetical protein
MHFRILQKSVMGFNGTSCLSHPAGKFLKAIIAAAKTFIGKCSSLRSVFIRQLLSEKQVRYKYSLQINKPWAAEVDSNAVTKAGFCPLGQSANPNSSKRTRPARSMEVDPNPNLFLKRFLVLMREKPDPPPLFPQRKKEWTQMALIRPAPALNRLFTTSSSHKGVASGPYPGIVA